MKRNVFHILAVLLLVTGLGIFSVSVATAQETQNASPSDAKSLVHSLKKGGYVIVLRHGATNQDQKDVTPPDFADVSKQRRLSDEGRATARKIGEAVENLGIDFDEVLTSKLDRGIETGKLVSGRDVVRTSDLTESADYVDSKEKMRRAEALRKMVGIVPEPGKNTLLVTHKPNIVEAFGKDLDNVGEGEAVVFHPDGTGKASLVGRIKPADWTAQ